MDLHRPLIHGLVLSLVLLPATSLAASGGPSACVPDRTSGAGDSAPLGASAEEEAGAGVIAWDLDGDGQVGLPDLAGLLASFGCSCPL